MKPRFTIQTFAPILHNQTHYLSSSYTSLSPLFASYPPTLPGTVTDASLAMMSFDIYDRDSKGRIEYDHMEEMVKVSGWLQRVG